MNFLSTLLASIILFGSIAFAQEEVKLTKDEFLSRLDKGSITLKKDPLFPGLNEAQRKEFLMKMKSKNPSFKEAFWFVPNLRTNNFVYTVFYEWPTRKCYFRAEGFDRNKKEYKRDEIDPAGTVIPVKYCEKAYGIKIN